MTTPTPDERARRACGCFICRCDLGQTVMGTTDRWRDARDEIISAGKRMELSNWTSCNYARILSALQEASEQASPVSRLVGPELAAAINALPDNVRAYIHDLETNADPAGTLQELAACRENVAGLTALLHLRDDEPA